MNEPFYPICPTCGHAHTADSFHFTGTICCAYCPKCESLQRGITWNSNALAPETGAMGGGGNWQHQWCRGVTSRGIPCKNREMVWVFGNDDHDEQFYCTSHISQHPKAYQKDGRWVIGR